MHADEGLAGKVAVVTGAGSGIGQAAALLLAQHGVRVGLIGRTEEKLARTAEKIREAGGEALLAAADVSRPEQVETAIRRVVDRFQRLELVFANAGINGLWAPIEKLAPEEFMKTISINLFGTFLTIKYAVPYLRRQGGVVVITSSVNGTRIFSNSGATAYSSSKAGQVAMMKMLAVELAPFGIRVNVVCPGATHTDIGEHTRHREMGESGYPVEYPKGKVPLTHGRAGSAEQVARAVVFLMSRHSDLVSGTELWVDGAESLLQG